MVNHLLQEASPYLKMHAQNPVNWYPWGEEALLKAKREDKPILLSIGYSACHWCHVMARESFENKETAAIMNQHFINIKVDREQRPDLDKVYQLSAQLLTQKVGGWPLTIFLMPENQLPFFAGTYFPKTRLNNFPSFQEILLAVHNLYSTRKVELQTQNISFQSILDELDAQAKISEHTLDPSPIEQGRQLLAQSFDKENGGFGSAPKFPMTASLEFLLLGDQEAQKKLTFSLKKMTEGGLYDHLGGGFFRYSVDSSWQIPHFEKMLYDNALLLFLLSQVSIFLNVPSLATFISGTAEWLLSEMQATEGGFYATLCADTEGKEGKFYIWKRDEIKEILTQDSYLMLSQYYGLDQYPNFDHQWHLQNKNSFEELAKKNNMELSELKLIIDRAKQKLFSIRAERTYPLRDNKIIVSWNGLAIKALAFAGFYTNQEKYVIAAQNAVDFIRNHLWNEKSLFSIYNEGKVGTTATLDDIVFLIEGIFYLLQASWRTTDLYFLQKLIQLALTQFEDTQAGGFYFTSSKQERLIYRLKQYADEAIPTSNGVFASVLLQVGYFLGNTHFIDAAEKALKNAFPHIKNHADFYCSFLSALQLYFAAVEIIIVRGKQDDLQTWRQIYQQYYRPNRFAFFISAQEILPSCLAQKKAIEGTIAYFCRGPLCFATIKKVEEFENELRNARE